MTKQKDYKLIIRRIALVIIDIISVIFASFFALATRFEFVVYNIPEEHWKSLSHYLPTFVVISLFLFFLFRIYSSLWEYAGLEEVFNIIWACVISGVVQFGIVLITNGLMPRSYYLLVIIYQVIFVAGTRFAYRYTRMRRQHRNFAWKNKKRVMLVGAGEAGNTLLTEMENSKYIQDKVYCVIDDDPAKIGKYIRGVKVVGNRYSIKQNVQK